MSIHVGGIYDYAMNDVTDVVRKYQNSKLSLDKQGDFQFKDVGKCLVCDKVMFYKRTLKKGAFDLEEVEIETCHVKCKRLKQRIDLNKEESLNLEFELFCLKS